MGWREIIRRLVLWLGFSIGFMILPIILSAAIYLVIGAKISIEIYIKEILFISVTLAATSLGDVFSLAKKGAAGLITTLMFVALVMMSLFCTAIYMIVNTCEALNATYDVALVNKATLILLIISFIISGSCQVFLAVVEGSKP